jgi:hypothetical protein
MKKIWVIVALILLVPSFVSAAQYLVTDANGEKKFLIDNCTLTTLDGKIVKGSAIICLEGKKGVIEEMYLMIPIDPSNPNNTVTLHIVIKKGQKKNNIMGGTIWGTLTEK